MQRFIGIGSIILALGTVVILTITREAPSKTTEILQPMQVTVHEVQPQSVDDVVIGYGQVSTRWQTILASEITGRVLRVSERLLAGAKFKKGDILATLDATSYEAALASANAALETSKRILKEEQQRAEIAADNWQTSGFQQQPSDLVLRKPQLHEARANITSSRAAVKKAQYDLAQTQIVAPYDGVVLERTVNPGDILQAGVQIARIYDHSVFEVRVPLGEQEMARLRHDIIHAPVTLITSQGKWPGKISRIEQSIDSKNRWKNIVVETHDTGGLLPGRFVTVELPGKNYQRVIVLPEHFVGRNDLIWFVNQQDYLQNFAANILFSKNGKLFILPPADLHTQARITPERDVYLAGVKVTPVSERSAHHNSS